MKDWSDTDIMWVSGGIDANGHVIGHHCFMFGYRPEEGEDWPDNCEPEHTPEEKASTPWRWSVIDQEFMDHTIPPPRNMTQDEVFAVQDWLIKHGYAEEESFE